MRKNKNSFFWPSFTDLMTSLFFVMLVLYLLTVSLYSRQKGLFANQEQALKEAREAFENERDSILNIQDSLMVSAERYKKIEEVEASVRELEKSGHFFYQADYKRFVISRPIGFSIDSDVIPSRDRAFLDTIGKEIEAIVSRQIDEDITYLLVIEGMASRDTASVDYNYELSYKRAYALYTYWTRQTGISFDPRRCEVIISGSGTGGVGRSPREEENRRFLIQVIPKISAK